MRWQLRQLQKGELDHELIWLTVSCVGAIGMTVWLWLHLPLPQCNFRALLGIPCLTCGSTRAASALLHGEMAQAWLVSPLATVAFCAMAAFDVYAIAILLSRAPRLRLTLASRNERRMVVVLLAVAVLLNWIYLLIRG
jgi:Protein of unknown function (DUF2752)